MPRPRALVADDDADFLAVIAKVVEQLGADVACVSSGRELLNQVADGGPFDVVIADVAMPWMTGLAAMQIARTEGVPGTIVIMTASRDESILAQVAALGERVTLLFKPFSMVALRDALRSGLDLGPGSDACLATAPRAR